MTTSPSESEEELRRKIAIKVEHDELGTYGEFCDGQYECVCDDDFVPYEVLGDLSLDEMIRLIKSHTNQEALKLLDRLERCSDGNPCTVRYSDGSVERMRVIDLDFVKSERARYE